jgi:thiol-disulfide isomerase/thioredoxin
MLLALTVTAQANPQSFTLSTTEGETINIVETETGLIFDKYSGKAIFLVMFGHNCPPCKAEIPEFIELVEKYKEKFRIVAIEAQRYNTKQLKNFKEENKINYDLVVGKEHENFIGYIAEKAKWKGEIPFLVALDKNGEVGFVQRGFIPRNTLEGLIEKLTK